MNPVFTMLYDEFLVADQLRKFLKKKDGYSVNAPLNRQQKGFDLLVHSSRSGKSARIQVKASRPYRGRRFPHGYWYNNFVPQKGAADFYVFLGMYPSRNSQKTFRIGRSPKQLWTTWMILLSDNRTRKILNSVKITGGKRAKFLRIEVDKTGKQIILMGGNALDRPQSLNNHKLKDRIFRLKQFIA